MRISVGCKIGIPGSFEDGTAAVSTALHADILPEIFIPHDLPENIHSAVKRISFIDERTALGYILHLSCCAERFIQFAERHSVDLLGPRGCAVHVVDQLRKVFTKYAQTFILGCKSGHHILRVEYFRDQRLETCAKLRFPLVVVFFKIFNEAIISDTAQLIRERCSRRIVGRYSADGSGMSRALHGHLHGGFDPGYDLI